jgi:hypothetical protein
MPEPYASIVERVCAADAAYFEANPGKRERTRPMVAGEFFPHQVPAGAWVRVVRLADGVRARELLA